VPGRVRLDFGEIRAGPGCGNPKIQLLYIYDLYTNSGLRDRLW
jgi:hypothetical protein